MKKTITKLAVALSLAATITTHAQTVSFETFTLSPNTFYQDLASTDFSNNGVTFRYGWNTAFGGYWESGSAYTNSSDTVNGTYTNLYGAITGQAFGGNNYATVQSGAIIAFSNTTTAVNGFYVTNTTYAWKEIKKGGFGRKFGDTTGTYSNPPIAQGEYKDWFKLSVLGYRNGVELTDTVHFYLADYTAAGTANDYVIKNWQYVNCLSLGQVDSIKFEMTSSDNNSFGMKTPAFFSIDNFVIQSTVGLNELTTATHLNVFPNPTSTDAFLNIESTTENNLSIIITDISGKEINKSNIITSIGKNQLPLNTEALESGIYFIKVSNETSSKTIKFIKL